MFKEVKKGRDKNAVKNEWNLRESQIKKAKDVPRYHFKDISESSVKFIDSLVRVDPKDRPTIATLTTHAYLNENLESASKLDLLYSDT